MVDNDLQDKKGKNKYKKDECLINKSKMVNKNNSKLLILLISFLFISLISTISMVNAVTNVNINTNFTIPLRTVDSNLSKILNNLLATSINLNNSFNDFYNNISVYNQTWLDFDGVDDWVNVSRNLSYLLSGSNLMTVCMDLDLKEFGQAQGLFGNRYSDVPINWTSLMFTSDNAFFFSCKNSTTEYAPVGASVITRLGKYSVCGYLTDKQSVIILNGFRYKVGEETGYNCWNYTELGKNIRIGTYHDAVPTRFFNGSIDNVRVYNRTLSILEFEKLYKGYDLVNFSNTNNFSQMNNLNVTSTVLIANSVDVTQDDLIREIGNIVYNATGTGEYLLTYTGYNSTYPGSEYVYWANSSDGNTWVKQGKVNISRKAEDPYLVYNGSNYFLYTEDKEPTTFRNITMWIFSGNLNSSSTVSYPIDKGTGWESTDVSSPVVLKEGNNWYMLYEGRGTGSGGGNIGLATSLDGITWTKKSDNPYVNETMDSPNPDFDMNAVVPDDIVIYNGIYYFTYHGGTSDGTWRGGYLTITNLSDKTTYIKPVDNLISRSADTVMFFGNFTNKMFLSDYVNYNITLAYASVGIRNYSDISSVGLVLDYELNENSGTTAYDVSGNGNNGTISGATWNNDGVKVLLKYGIDWTFNQVTGIINLGNYIYSSIFLDNVYNDDICPAGSTVYQSSSDDDTLKRVTCYVPWLNQYNVIIINTDTASKNVTIDSFPSISNGRIVEYETTNYIPISSNINLGIMDSYEILYLTSDTCPSSYTLRSDGVTCTQYDETLEPFCIPILQSLADIPAWFGIIIVLVFMVVIVGLVLGIVKLVQFDIISFDKLDGLSLVVSVVSFLFLIGLIVFLYALLIGGLCG